MDLNIWVAFFAGLASFISPCTLPLYPTYISYITGISVSRLQSEMNNRDIRRRTLTHTLFFVLGFSVIYYSLGAAAGMVAETFIRYQDLLSKLAGLMIIVMGLFLLGIFQPKLLMREFKINMKTKPVGYFGTFLIGIGFAAGWSPCVGPILSAIIALASSEQGSWFKLITAYTIGFSVPFFVLAFFIGSMKGILKYSNLLMKIGGVLMIVFGLLLYTGYLIKISNMLQGITPDWLRF